MAGVPSHDIYRTREIIGITETWVDIAGRDFEGEYRLPCYSLFHQDRAGRALGGGVMLYEKCHLNPVQIPIVTRDSL